MPRYTWDGTTLPPSVDLAKEALDGLDGGTECPMVHDFQNAYNSRESFGHEIAHPQTLGGLTIRDAGDPSGHPPVGMSG